jgi:hypothetical protein
MWIASRWFVTCILTVMPSGLPSAWLRLRASLV